MINYTIVPSIDAINNYEMLNNSTSNNFTELRKNRLETKYIFEFDPDKKSYSGVFDIYQWYSREAMLTILQESEW